MAIADDWTIDYTNRMIYHDSGTTVYEMWELYSWIMDEIDDNDTIDDTVPMTAQTPTAYTLVNSWYINENYYSSFEFLKGGALKTSAWDASSNATGIQVITFAGTYNDCVSTDIGKGVTGPTSSHTGTLLDYDNTAQKWWVRVDDTGDVFDNTTEAIDVDSGTGDGIIGSGTVATGEALWTNIYTLGTIEEETSMYLYQDNSQITSWWSAGHIDILAKVREAGSLIDLGNLTVYARKYSTLYENFAVDASSGGRIPIPMGTADDLNNDTGYLTMVFTTASADFTEGEVIDGGTSGAKGIVTSNSGTAPNTTIEYYLIDDTTVDFHSSGAETVTGASSSSTATTVAPAATGPNTGDSAAITVTFGGADEDLSNGSGSRPYSVVVDLLGNATVAEAYERLKYLTRRGQTSNIDDGTQTITGEQYEGIGDLYIPYDNASTDPPFTEGEVVTGPNNFTGTITSVHDQGANVGFIIVRNTSGTTPVDDDTISNSGGSGDSVDVHTDSGADPVGTVAQTNDAPFGTFAGGKFFGARGVFLDNVPAADSTNYELIDSEGQSQIPPNIVNITVTGVTENTRCFVYDSVPTTYLNADATDNVVGGGADEYEATNTLTYASDINVTVRAREMGYLPFETSGTITDAGITVTAVWLVDANFKFVVTGESVTFADANPDTIQRGTGDFATDGWIGEMSQVTVEGSTNNDGTYEIASIATDTITLEATETLTAGTDASGVTLTFTRLEKTWT